MINTIDLPVDRSTAAAASSAHNRINVPLNLQNWTALPGEHQDLLGWFHQHLLDEGMGWEAAANALGFNSDDHDAGKNLFAVLKGTYEGDWDEMMARIRDYQKIALERVANKNASFVLTPSAKLIWAGLDYALSSNSMVLLKGESGHGKSVSGQAWLSTRAKGRGVMTEVPMLGGTRGFLSAICKATGNNQNASITQMCAAIFRAFNRDRILILDEATRLLPKDRRIMPDKLEFVREIHDRTGAPIAMFITQRFDEEMEQNSYIYEQVLGRSLPIRLPGLLAEDDYRPLVVQYFPRPTKKLMEVCEQIANNKLARQKGRLRTMVKIFALANRMAEKEREKNPRVRFGEEHFFKALALREKFRRSGGPEDRA
ncbi:MAG TPA: ATP-binding protein [Opitutaceae bacterium]|nr:ATP-binding protein [Opitutaceae bacterium]HRJ47530.1 ATP-binding protein [Opitutaceae bacterium]